jgi:hypothetical protein
MILLVVIASESVAHTFFTTLLGHKQLICLELSDTEVGNNGLEHLSGLI